jgi:hypothetical protein
MFEMEAVPYSCIPWVHIGLRIAFYRRILLLVESFDFSPSSQCILVDVTPTCYHFVNMCSSQVSLLSTCNLRYLTLDTILLRKVYVAYVRGWMGGGRFLVVMTEV